MEEDNMRKSISRRNFIYLSCVGTLACGLNACKLSGLRGDSGKDDRWKTPPSSTEGLYGFIDVAGDWAIKPQFNRGSNFSKEGIAPVSIRRYVEGQGNFFYSGVITTLGQWVKDPNPGFSLGLYSRFDEGLVGVAARKHPGNPSDEDLAGYMNTKGELAIEPKFSLGVFDYIGYFSAKNSFIAEPYAIVPQLINKDDEGESHYLFGIINKKGTYLIEPRFGGISGRFTPGIASVGLAGAKESSKEDALFGLIDGSGDWVVRPAFKSVSSFTGNYAEAADATTGLEGTIDPSGEWVFPPQYIDLNLINESYAIAKDPETELVGILDPSTGGWIIEPRWHDAWLASSNNTYIIAREKKDSLMGVYSIQTGETILEPKYSIIDYGDPLNAAKDVESELWGYIDESGEWVIPPQFRYASRFYKGLASASSNK